MGRPRWRMSRSFFRAVIPLRSVQLFLIDLPLTLDLLLTLTLTLAQSLERGHADVVLI